MTETYLGSSAAAKHVGVSKCTLLRAVHRGEIAPARRTPGGQFRFRAADLDAYAQHLRPPHAAGPKEAATRDLMAAVAALAALPSTSSPERLATETMTLLAERLDVGAVALARREGTALRLEQVCDRAGLGLQPGMELAADRYETALLAPGHALAVADTHADARFVTLGALRLLGVRAYTAVPLQYADGRPYGALCTLHPAPRTVDGGEAVLLTLAGRSLMHAVEQVNARAREAQLVREAATRAAEFATVLDHLPCGVVVVDATGRITFMNAQGRQTEAQAVETHEPLATQAAAFAIRPLQCQEPGAPLTPAQTPIARALAGETVPPRAGLVHFPGADEDRVLETAAVPLRDASGAVYGAVAIFSDVTVRVQAEQAHQRSDARFRALSEHASDLVRIVDAAGIIRYASPSHQALLGYTPEELVGRPAAPFIHPADLAVTPLCMRDVERRAGHVHTSLYRMRHANGTWRWLEVKANARLTDPAIQGVIINARDVTERMVRDETLRHQVLHDPLTQLPNRTLLQERVAQAVRGTQRDPQPLAVLLLDIDHFKEVNDSLGHMQGDRVLWQVAARLRGAVRASDTVARLGGDAFAVLLAHCDATGAVRAARRLRQILAAPLKIEGQTLRVQASIGIALAPDHGQDPAALLRCAAVAMDAAKRTGDACAVYAADHDTYTSDRLALIADLRQAITQGELSLHYQPKVEVATGQPSSVEALVRWRHPQRGLIPPDQFIPLAEQAGLMAPLTWWVLEEAVRQGQRWQRAGYGLDIAVNVSMATLHDPAFPDTIVRLLRAARLPSSWLRLEVTESTLMTDVSRTQEVLSALATLGVGLSVDDYGTGYSSLAYLKRLPVDELKIDLSFVRQMAADETDAAIVRSTIGLGHSLGLRVVAEGVEDQGSWEMLAQWGCDVAQGYYLSRPLPAADLERWLETVDGERASA